MKQILLGETVVSTELTHGDLDRFVAPGQNPTIGLAVPAVDEIVDPPS